VRATVEAARTGQGSGGAREAGAVSVTP
jgi:hypothetical protein